MKILDDILKISIILMIVLIAVGSAYAADDSPSELNDDSGDDFELDDSNDDLEDDENQDDDDDSDNDLEDDENQDDDDDSDEDLDDDDLDHDDDSDEDLDDDESDDNYSDFDYLEYKIMAYLERYGNCTDDDWTESEEFLNEYQTYLADPSNYVLNESAEGYKTYLKIFDSITSTFGNYNLTDNETAYLKFMIIYYLNHYGNVSADYEWNESESFENFTLPKFFATALPDIAKVLQASHSKPCIYSDSYDPFYALFYDYVSNSVDVNRTANGNHTAVGNNMVVEAQDSNNVFIFILILIFVFAVLILI